MFLCRIFKCLISKWPLTHIVSSVCFYNFGHEWHLINFVVKILLVNQREFFGGKHPKGVEPSIAAWEAAVLPLH